MNGAGFRFSRITHWVSFSNEELLPRSRSTDMVITTVLDRFGQMLFSHGSQFLASRHLFLSPAVNRFDHLLGGTYCHFFEAWFFSVGKSRGLLAVLRGHYAAPWLFKGYSLFLYEFNLKKVACQ